MAKLSKITGVEHKMTKGRMHHSQRQVEISTNATFSPPQLFSPMHHSQENGGKRTGGQNLSPTENGGGNPSTSYFSLSLYIIGVTLRTF